MAEEDSFDKLFGKLTITDKKENLDPFDQLFNNVPNQTQKKGSVLSVKNHSSLSPDLSVPEEDNSTENVLFSSFSKTSLKTKSGKSRVFKPKTKSHRVKSATRTKSEAAVKVHVHDETLDVKMIFADSVQSPLPTGSSLAHLSPGSINFGWSTSLATSTPLVSKSQPQGRKSFRETIKSFKHFQLFFSRVQFDPEEAEASFT